MATPDSLVDLAFRVEQSGKAKDADVNALALSFLNIMRPNHGVMEAPAKLVVVNLWNLLRSLAFSS